MSLSAVVRRVSALLIAALLLGIGALVATPASASAPPGYEEGGPVVRDPNPAGPATEATVVAMRDTSGLYGGFVDGAGPQTPYPSTGLRDQDSFTTAQIVLDDPRTPGAEELLTYCIDIGTDTTIGVHYELGQWNEIDAEVLPYVQWILNNYYPKVPDAPVVGTAAEKVRAVQGAIWYFTDKFVVNRFYPAERDAVRSIVEAAQAALAGGTPPAPAQPTITVAPDAATAAPGAMTGPYTVDTANLAGTATIEIPSGTEVFRDAVATPSQQVANGAPIADGEQLWARFVAGAVDPGFVVAGSGTVPAGNVYDYDGSNPPRTSAQRLVLAADAVMPVRAAVDITPAAAGALQVQVTIAGAAAGAQGQIDLEVSCPSWPQPRPAYRVANAPAGTAVVATFDGLPVGDACTLAVVDDGENAYAVPTPPDVTQPQPIPAGGTATAAVAVDYAVPAPPVGSSLDVNVTIEGSAAGLQSALELVVTCESGTDAVTRSFSVDAGITGTTTVATVSNLPRGAQCRLVQPVDGRNADAQFDASASSILPDPAVIAEGRNTVTATNVYVAPTPPVGTLAVDLTVDGEAAGRQGPIALTATCTLDGEVRSIPIPVAAGVTGTSRVATIADVEAGSVCAVTQTSDGAGARAVLSATSIAPVSVEIRGATTSVIAVADTFATPTPTPTPTPTGGALPVTGGASPVSGLWIAGAAVLVGAGALAVDLLRRRRARTR